MKPEKEELLTALAWMCEQYLSTPDGLDHLCMNAGEMAIKALHQHGLVDTDERGANWTSAGKKLLEYT